MSNLTCYWLILSLFSHQVMSDSSRPHGLQHSRLPCLSPSLGVRPSSWPSSWWCHSTISSSVAFFSFCLQSFPASGTFPMGWLFPSGDQDTGASVSVLQVSIQVWFPLRSNGLISFLPKGLSRVFFSTTVQKHQFFSAQSSLWSSSHTHAWPQEKP